MSNQQPHHRFFSRVRSPATLPPCAAWGGGGTAVRTGRGVRPRAAALRERGRGVVGHGDTDHGGACAVRLQENHAFHCCVAPMNGDIIPYVFFLFTHDRPRRVDFPSRVLLAYHARHVLK